MINTLTILLNKCYNGYGFENHLSPIVIPGVGFTSKERRYYTIVLDYFRRPSDDYSNKQWQLDFEKLKTKIQPSRLSKMPVTPDGIINGTYHGKTQYQYYCGFINDILKNIRNGQVDYCFYVYQVAELLKYEHDRLKVTWLKNDGCFHLTL
jgi:hypothetical protein